ncbi:MAG: peptidylprolyl isomerase [Planctomycetota bacterium]
MKRTTFDAQVAVQAAALATLCATSATAEATIVRFETVLGDIDVRLFDTATPASVANFLNYVTDGDYDDSFIHRAPPGFVLQGGGFRWLENDANVSSVPTDAPVVNEPGLSNLTGTLAYAKLGGDPNSATSGWFFSVGDNSANLDFQNGGFTVFGSVVGDGLDVIDDLAALSLVNAGGAFTTLPVLDTFAPPTVFREDLVFVNTIVELSLSEGDYDFDGDVDLDDYAVWQSEFGNSLRIIDQPTDIEMNADGNGDGVVDAADYTVWRDSFNAASASAVPEPLSAMLAALGALSVPLRRR